MEEGNQKKERKKEKKYITYTRAHSQFFYVYNIIGIKLSSVRTCPYLKNTCEPSKSCK